MFSEYVVCLPQRAEAVWVSTLCLAVNLLHENSPRLVGEKMNKNVLRS